LSKRYSGHHRDILQQIARRAMIDRGFFPDFSDQVISELNDIQAAPDPARDGFRDLRSLPWCSIDNDDSRDLDQLTVAQALKKGIVKILIAVADVDATVMKGGAINGHARHNTTSIYTAAQVFHMLPERLSTNLTSLNDREDRWAIVVEIVIGKDGTFEASDIYRAWVRNHVKLAYGSVAAWLAGRRQIPRGIMSIPGLDQNLHLQDRAAQRLRRRRYARGALSLDTVEARPVFVGEEVRELRAERKNRAKALIEDFMIAANEVTACYLESKGFPSVRRVVRQPKRWERIVEVASGFGYRLPESPDSEALQRFLTQRRTADPAHFHDLSQTIIKLIGPGGYETHFPGETPQGHFGLAVKCYTHSTAPNRRFADLITQRLLKAALDGSPVPYSREELAGLALHITRREDDANKVERLVRKSAAALVLVSKIGKHFNAIVTGAAPKGTWVRIGRLPIEGRLVEGYEGVDVGDRLRVQLVRVDVKQGFIDFRKIKRHI
jgi:VacB/RNase II family 3'-5' exoribonuclease